MREITVISQSKVGDDVERDVGTRYPISLLNLDKDLVIDDG